MQRDYTRAYDQDQDTRPVSSLEQPQGSQASTRQRAQPAEHTATDQGARYPRPAMTFPPQHTIGASLLPSGPRCPVGTSASVPGSPGAVALIGSKHPAEHPSASPFPFFQASSTPGSPASGQPGSTEESGLRGAWVDFLGRWSWDLFGNHTFREDAHPEAAVKRFRLFISILNRKLYGPRWHKQGRGIRWVCAMERQARGVVHFHSLLSSPELVELLRSSWSPAEVAGRWQNDVLELWNSLAGFARIEPIDNAAAVRGYVSKYVIKGGEIDLGGPGMPEETRTGYPARVDRRWLTTAMGRATAQAILDQVTTPEERSALMTWANAAPGSRRETASLREAVRLRALAARVGKPLSAN